ncbi:MAG: tetratricopeptide repeat protein [Patescibacteria group bacterium]
MNIENNETKENKKLPDNIEKLIRERRKTADQMTLEGKSVKEILEKLGNNYDELDKYYEKETGSKLAEDPYQSFETNVEIKNTTISIVIPAYNNGERLQKCLSSIEASTFNNKYNDRLEVVVVDDGSTRGESHISDAVQELFDKGLVKNLNIKVCRQENGGPIKARYTGVNMAKNSHIIFHDPDVVLNPNSIEEYAKRFEKLDNIIMFGARGHIEMDDPKISLENLKGNLPNLPYDLEQDGRWCYDHLSDYDYLKRFGQTKDIWIDHGEWGPYSFFWGLNIAAKKEDLIKIGVGYDERIKGWGAEDDILAAQLLSLGNYIVPCPSAFCHHISHETRIDEKKRQKNVETLHSNLNSTRKHRTIIDMSQVETKIDAHSWKVGLEVRPTIQPGNHAKAIKMLKSSFYAVAEKYIMKARQENPGEPWLLADSATILLKTMKYDDALEFQKAALHQIPNNPYVKITMAEILTRIGDYDEAMKYYRDVNSNNPNLDEVKFLKSDVNRYKDEGSQYLKEGKSRLALEFLDKAIIIDPNMMWAEYDKGHAFMQLGDTKNTLKSAQRCKNLEPNNTWVRTFLGRVLIENGRNDEAKKELNEALKMDDNNSEARELLKKI